MFQRWILYRVLSLVLFVFSVTLLIKTGLALAQEATIAPAVEPAWKQLLTMALNSLVPAVWVAVGPMAVAAITGLVNASAKKYVPRPVQVVLSGIMTAVVAGLSGDVVSASQAVGMGMGAQVLAATNPDTLLTSKKPTDGA